MTIRKVIEWAIILVEEESQEHHLSTEEVIRTRREVDIVEVEVRVGNFENSFYRRIVVSTKKNYGKVMREVCYLIHFKPFLKQ